MCELRWKSFYNLSQCTLRLEAKTDACSEKNLRKTLEKSKGRAEEIGEKEDGDQEKSLDLDTRMDLEVENWAKSSE